MAIDDSTTNEHIAPAAWGLELAALLARKNFPLALIRVMRLDGPEQQAPSSVRRAGPLFWVEDARGLGFAIGHSELTGAGFTTSGSGQIASQLVARRVVGTLMRLGNLGIVAGSGTLILSLIGIEERADAT